MTRWSAASDKTYLVEWKAPNLDGRQAAAAARFFAVPRLRAMVGANALLGEALRIVLPKLGRETGRWALAASAEMGFRSRISIDRAPQTKSHVSLSTELPVLAPCEWKGRGLASEMVQQCDDERRAVSLGAGVSSTRERRLPDLAER